jgi:hypothetical protein
MNEAIGPARVLGRLIARYCPARIFAARKGVFLLITSVALLASGCGSAVETVWSVEVPSPDHQWIASGRTDQISGPGNADLSTGVYLKRINRSDPAATVLLFQNEPASSKQAITLTMV